MSPYRIVFKCYFKPHSKQNGHKIDGYLVSKLSLAASNDDALSSTLIMICSLEIKAYRSIATLLIWGAGSGVQEATTSCAAMRHRIAAAIGWSRLETVDTIERPIMSTPQGVAEPLPQTSSQKWSERP